MATTAQVNAFISLIAPSVQKKCKERGWGVPSAIIAQAGLESAWGTSGLSSTCYNYFGMKWKEGCGCGYKEYNTGEQRPDGTRYTVKAKFRKYGSVEEGIEGYFKFIESYSRYKPVMASKTYTEYATQLKQCGWATSIQYTKNIITTLEKHNLQVYDGNATNDDYIILPNKVLKQGSKGPDVLHLQKSLNRVAGKMVCSPDGEYGPITKEAVKNVQTLAVLLKIMNERDVDGIYGNKTRLVLKNAAENQGIIVK